MEFCKKKKPRFTRRKGSLQHQMLVLTMSIILVCVLVIGLSFFWASATIVRQNQIESTLDQISHAASGIAQDLNKVGEIMGYLFVDNQIQEALDLPTQTNYQRTLQWNEIYSALSTYERLDYFRYVNCIILYNADEYAHSFRYMALDTDPYVRRNQELGWYDAAIENEGRLVWSTDVSLSDAYLPYEKRTGTDISVMRALRTNSYKDIQGAVYLSIQPSFLSVFQKNNGLDNMQVFVLDNTGRLLNPEDSFDEFSPCLEVLEQTPWVTEHYRYCDAGQYIAYEYTVPTHQYRLIVFQPDDNTFFVDQTILVLGISIICVLVLIALSLRFFLTRSVIRPVQELAGTMKMVHDQGLSVRAPDSDSNEFDYLATTFNYMLDQIQNLVQENLEKERLTQEAEYNVILAQMNPHFLYNALFSIRMMAVLQKADNIRDMVDALWRMLKNSTTRGKNDFTLRDELQNVEDYVHILRASNVQKFHVTYHIEPELYNAPCPKFLIQPVVENAIIHGVLPKQGFSKIEISARILDGFITITVSNDGLPISADRLEEVNSNLHKHAAAHKGLGLSSINQRLKLLYGEDAKLTLSSDVESHKTVVQIRYRTEMRD